MTDLDRRQREIADEFAFLDDWMLRFEHVVEHGRAMAPMPDTDKTDDRLIRGCQSRVWLQTWTDGGRLHVRADSESQLVRGLASLLVRIVDGAPAEAVAGADFWFVREIGLAEHLSPNRSNGLDAMLRAIRAAAA